jgi:hypothetical protein
MLSWSAFVPCNLFTRLIGTRVAHEAATLFFKTTAIEVADANSRPAKLGHDLCEVPVRPCITLALWYLQNTHQLWRADALQAVEPCLSPHALQAETLWAYGLRGFGRRRGINRLFDAQLGTD